VDAAPKPFIGRTPLRARRHEAKGDKALNMALDLMRGTKISPAFPPNPKSAIPSN
jgi:hypothetical protein